MHQRALEGMELYGRLLDVHGERLILDDDLALCLDQADQVSESIKTSIDGLIGKNGIVAPSETRYRSVWVPAQERPELDYRAVGITSIVCLRRRLRFVRASYSAPSRAARHVGSPQARLQ
jgi:putative flavoprotein involved in K+ transport